MIGDSFLDNLPEIAPSLLFAVRSTMEPTLCCLAVGIIGDVMAALGSKAPESFCDEVMSALLQNVRLPELPQSTRPPILSCFGDIALHLESKFEKYLPIVLNVLESASNAVNNIDSENEDLMGFGRKSK